MKKFISAFTLALFGVVIACNIDKGEEKMAPSDETPSKEHTEKMVNPNGDSELALLMREMYEEGKKMKHALKNNTMPAITVKYHQITTATATEQEETETEEFRAFSRAYIAAMENLEKATTVEEAQDRYNTVISTCLSCHVMACPGPVVKIKKMNLKQ